jgi:glucose uptake protein
MQPASSLGVTICALACLILWALWPVFAKRLGRLRWEFYFYDFILGAVIAALIAGFTLGTFGAEITFRDNIAIVGYRQLGFAAVAGAIFGLGAIMLVAATAVAGAAVAGTLIGAVALTVGAIIAYFSAGVASTGVQFGGIALALAIFVVIARFHSEANRLQRKDATHKTPMRKKVDTVSAGIVLVLCIVGGIGLGSFQPFIDWARISDLPLTAYPVAALFTAGLFSMGFVLNLYFVNLPVQGEPISPVGFVTMPPLLHLGGLLSGVVFAAGLIAYLLIQDAPASVAPPRGLLLALLPASLGLFAILGRTVWNEYDEAIYRTKTAFLASGFCLILASLAVLVGYL